MTTPIISGTDEADLERHIAPTSSSGKSYFCSYRIIEVLICLIPLPIGVLLEFPTPYERPIPYQTIDDNGETIKAFMYDNRYSGETVPSTMMFALAIAVPFILQIGLIFCVGKSRGERCDLIHKTFCVYFMAVGLTQTLTNLAKQYVGYLRPIFYDMCEPEEDFSECTNEEGRQARLSFPSGHASMSICGLLLFSLFLEKSFGKSAYQKKMKINGHQQQEPYKLVRIVSVLCYTPAL